jgi:indole-3-glycerol phosphate synthase
MILDAIVENKRKELEERKERVPERHLVKMLERRARFADFRETISKDKGRVKLIGEIKKASPSAGVIKEDFDPVAVARVYQAGGADALSVLTEEKYFLGRLEHISAMREGGIVLPILRKDFICDLYQVLEAAAFGADAVLLIIGLMTREDMGRAMRACEDYRLAAVVEVHTEEHLKEAVDMGAAIVQINNRDLRTFQVDLGTTEKLVPLIPKGTIVISASGLSSPEELRRLKEIGVDAALIGEALMRHPDPAGFIKELAEAAR